MLVIAATSIGGTLAQVRSYFDGFRAAVPAHAAVHFAPLQRTRLPAHHDADVSARGARFPFPGLNSPDFLACYVLQQVLSSSRSALANLVDTGAALDAEWVSRPYIPGRPSRHRHGRARTRRGPLAMTKRLEGIVKQYATPRGARRAVRDDQATIDRGPGVRPNSISSLANDWATTIALDGEPSIKREQELIAAVTLADVNRVAQAAISTRSTPSSAR